MMTPGAASLSDLRAVMDGSALALAPGWRADIEASAAALARLLGGGGALYGVNTGFGKLASTRIAPDRLAQYRAALTTLASSQMIRRRDPA